MKLKDGNGIMSREQLLNIRFILNKEHAPLEGRTLILNEEAGVQEFGEDRDTHCLFGFLIKKSPNVDPNAYEVWMDKVQYIV